jgi:hypothetical protein
VVKASCLFWHKHPSLCVSLISGWISLCGSCPGRRSIFLGQVNVHLGRYSISFVCVNPISSHFGYYCSSDGGRFCTPALQQ